MKRSILCLALSMVAGCATVPDRRETLHQRLLTLDTHLDIPLHFSRAGWHFGDRHNLASDLSQVDLPRMADGNLDGGFFAIYTAQGPLTPAGYADAKAFALRRSSEIDHMIVENSPRVALATTAADALRLNAQHRLIAFKSIENSYPIGEDLSLLDEFYRQGVRLAGPVHGTNNQFADSATDQPHWNGLSPLGRQWVKRMNELGIVIDASHSSDATFDQLLALSRTPLLLSHSGSRAAFEHPRNLDDVRLRKLAAGGGAICFTTIYLSPIHMTPERAAVFGKLDAIGSLTPAEQTELTAKWRALDARDPMWSATFGDYMKGLLHTISVVGADHVCFGGDWDGGGGIAGLADITDHPKITAALKAAGYSDEDLAKMWSGNVLRILAAADAARERF